MCFKSIKVDVVLKVVFGWRKKKYITSKKIINTNEVYQKKKLLNQKSQSKIFEFFLSDSTTLKGLILKLENF